jgi:hypothetical protein
MAKASTASRRRCAATIVIHASPSYTWRWRVWLFRDTDVEFIVSIPHCMVATVYAPFELPECGWLYVLHKGVVMNGGLILTTGRWWGEDMIVHNETYRKQLVARALTFLETYSIDRGTLYDLAPESFPATLRQIRMRAVVLALTRKLQLERKAGSTRDRQNSDQRLAQLASGDVFDKIQCISEQRAKNEGAHVDLRRAEGGVCPQAQSSKRLPNTCQPSLL